MLHDAFCTTVVQLQRLKLRDEGEFGQTILGLAETVASSSLLLNLYAVLICSADCLVPLRLYRGRASPLLRCPCVSLGPLQPWDQGELGRPSWGGQRSGLILVFVRVEPEEDCAPCAQVARKPRLRRRLRPLVHCCLSVSEPLPLPPLSGPWPFAAVGPGRVWAGQAGAGRDCAQGPPGFGAARHVGGSARGGARGRHRARRARIGKDTIHYSTV